MDAADGKELHYSATATISNQPVLISNAQVLDLLQKKAKARKARADMKGDGDKPQKKSQRNWIEEQVIDYLRCTPCTKLDLSRHEELNQILQQARPQPSRHTNPRKKRKLSRSRAAVKEEPTETSETNGKKDTSVGDESSSINLSKYAFDLTNGESLQILNFMPTELVEIHLMVEELHARMSEDQQDTLLQVVQEYTTTTTSSSSSTENAQSTK